MQGLIEKTVKGDLLSLVEIGVVDGRKFYIDVTSLVPGRTHSAIEQRNLAYEMKNARDYADYIRSVMPDNADAMYRFQTRSYRIVES